MRGFWLAIVAAWATLEVISRAWSRGYIAGYADAPELMAQEDK